MRQTVAHFQNFANIFLILEHYALWKADNMMMIMMMHAQEFTGVC